MFQGTDSGFEQPVRVGVDAQTDHLARLQLGGGLFRHREVDEQSGKVGQGHYRVAGVEVLPQVGPANAQHSGERRADSLLVDHGLDAGDISAHLVIVGLSLIQLRLCGSQQQDFTGTVQGQPGIFGLGL
ncbi:hypothetical protein FQZ97_726520 [compost metagenome]